MISAIFLGLVLANNPPVTAEWTHWQAQPQGLQRLVHESRILFYWGEGETTEKRGKWIEGREKAETARELSPQDPGALFWWTANVGAIARADKNLSALKRIKEIEEILLALRLKEPGFGFNAPDRVLGRIYQEAPRFISIGSTSKAEQHLRSALAGHPEFPGIRLAWVEFLAADERWEETRKEIALLKKQGWEGDFRDFNLERAGWPDRLASVERTLAENLK